MTIQEINIVLTNKIELQIELIKHLEEQIKVQQDYISLLKLRPKK